ncbi:hypothetical protein ZWY2020_033173 [Hordeum vulgare]|nr:hypothetical protein ZWY2020_033173 [Hordeum vulgare]
MAKHPRPPRDPAQHSTAASHHNIAAAPGIEHPNPSRARELKHNHAAHTTHQSPGRATCPPPSCPQRCVRFPFPPSLSPRTLSETDAPPLPSPSPSPPRASASPPLLPPSPPLASAAPFRAEAATCDAPKSAHLLPLGK